jgi:hypothetical protein
MSQVGMVTRWRQDLEHDPHYIPNLSTVTDDQPFAIKRHPLKWRVARNIVGDRRY